MLTLAAIVAAGAIAAGSFAVLLWASAVLTLALAAAWWFRMAWRDVDVDVAFEPAKVFEQEPVRIRITIRNDKRIVLPIARIRVLLPDGLLPAPSIAPGALRGHRRRVSVAARSETQLVLPVYATHRGEFWLEPLEISLADPFDVARAGRTIDVPGPLLVMPDARGGVPLPVIRRLPFGAPAPAARLFEDREHFAGVRDYERGDPIHHVHWKISAHAGRLQTKRFDPTRSAEVLFALDLSCGEPFWQAVNSVGAEETIGWASYVARQAIAAGWRVGLVANTHLRRGRGPLRVASSASAGQEAVLFAALARMPSQPTVDLAPVLREIARRLPRRCTILVLSPSPGPALLREIEVLRRRGADVVHVSPLAARGGAA